MWQAPFTDNGRLLLERRRGCPRRAEEEGSIGDRRIKVWGGGGTEAGVMWRR